MDTPSNGGALQDAAQDVNAEGFQSANLTLWQALGLAGDARLDSQDEIGLEVLKSNLGDVLYVEAISLLAGRRPQPPEARGEWESLLAHRAAMEQKLGRQVGVQAAALDRFYPARPEGPQIISVPFNTFEAILRDSRVDPITGLSTRGSFGWALDHEIRRARRYRKNVSLVLIDLDDTGDLNQRKGQVFADFVLRETAGLIRRSIRATDTAARLDEDIFGVILPECKVSDARNQGERIRSLIENQSFAMFEGDDGAHITASIGIAGYPRNANDAESVMAAARETLFRAKEMGKNRVEFD